jgi:hypothetical protein
MPSQRFDDTKILHWDFLKTPADAIGIPHPNGDQWPGME